MQELRLNYDEWKALIGALPIFYIALVTGYRIWAIGSSFSIAADISSAEDVADFEATYKPTATAAGSADDAFLMGLLANGVPFIHKARENVDGYALTEIASPLDEYGNLAVSIQRAVTLTVQLDGYSAGPLPVMVVSPNRTKTSIDGYSTTFVPVKLVSPNRVGTNIDGYSVGHIPVKLVSPNRIGTSVDGYSVAFTPVKIVSPNRVSVSIDGYSISPLPVKQGPKAAGIDAWPNVLYDASGNPVGVVLDTTLYRIQADAKVAKGATSTSLVHLDAIDTVSGRGRLKATLYTESGDAVSFGSVPPNPSSIRNDFVRHSGSDSLLINGSVTPVVFTYDAYATLDISIQEIKFTLVANSITFGSNAFGGTVGPLANGLLVEIVAGGNTGTLYNLVQDESFVNFASPGGFNWTVSSKDMMSTSYLVGGGLRLLAGSGDQVRVTVRDNLTAAGTYFKCFVKGNLLPIS